MKIDGIFCSTSEAWLDNTPTCCIGHHNSTDRCSIVGISMFLTKDLMMVAFACMQSIP